MERKGIFEESEECLSYRLLVDVLKWLKMEKMQFSAKYHFKELDYELKISI